MRPENPVVALLYFYVHIIRCGGRERERTVFGGFRVTIESVRLARSSRDCNTSYLIPSSIGSEVVVC